MPSTYTGNLGIELPADGELDGVWGDVVNDNMNIIDRAINGSLALALSGTSSTLTTSDGSLSDGQYKLLVLGGSPSGTHTITIAPSNAQKIYFVRNTTAQSVVFTQGSGGNVTVATGDSAIIYSDGAGAGAAVVNITNDFAMSSVKITGGTIDGTVIGGTSAAAGTFTTANATTVDTTNIEVTTLKAKDGTSAGSIADSTGVVTLASSVLTTTDINGGTIDGTVIGGTSAAAGTFTTVTASGQASFADGTAAAPSITNTGDLDAGLFFPAADTVAVATAGTERMRITSAGNVGIGTTAPAAKLEVALGANGEYMRVGGDDATNNRALRFTSSTSTGSVGALHTINASGSAGVIALATASTERMRIDSAGNVGIGTNSPGEKVVIEGATPFLLINNTDETKSGVRFADQQNIGERFQAVYDAGAAAFTLDRVESTGVITERMRITSAGNVVIGNGETSATPTNGIMQATGGSGTDIAGASLTIQGGRGTGTGAGGSLLFSTAAAGTTGSTLNTATTRMTIDSSGNLGINNNPPAWGSTFRAITVNGSGASISSNGSNRIELGTNSYIEADNSTYRYVVSNAAAKYSQATGFHQWYTAPSGTAGDAITFTERMRLTNTGEVGIATTSPAGLLEVFDVLTVPARNTTTIASKRGLSIYNNQSAGSVDTTLVYGNTASAYLAIGNHNGTSYAERMRIDASGNVGIGTSSPAARVHIVASSLAGQLRIQDVTTDATTKNGVVGGGHYTNAEEPFSGMLLTSAASANKVDIGGGVSSMNAATSIVFSTAANTTTLIGTERMRIDSTGNLGIGTTSPDTRVTISASGVNGLNLSQDLGNSVLSSRLMLSNATAGQTTVILNNTGSLLFSTGATVNSSSGTERMRIDTSGNVGIGVTPNSAWSTFKVLQLSTVGCLIANDFGSNNAQVILGSNTYFDSGFVYRYLISSTSASRYQQAAGSHIWYNAPSGTAGNAITFTQAMTLDASGNLGIGNTSPVTRLHVTGASMTTGVVYMAQPAQTSKAAAATLTIAELLTGIIQYTGSAATLTLPTGTLIEGGLPATFPTNMSFDVSFINTGAALLTIGTATDLTLVGTMTVATGTSGLLRFRKTAANTYTVYRIS